MSFSPASAILCCVLIGTTLAYAQGVDVRGTVSDSASGEKLPYASVLILGLNKGCPTNMIGFYLIANIFPGTYEIAVTCLGYQRSVKSITVKEGDPINVNFQLKATPIEMTEVVVTGRQQRELTEINTSMHVMEPQDIQRIPSAVQNDLFQAIQILPGVVAAGDVSAKFYVRGGGGDQNLIMLDGMKLYNPFHAFGLFSVFDADIIKATEVYTAAFPPGFGDRLSSVVNVTTRTGNINKVEGRANLNLLSTKLQMEGPLLGNSSWIFSGRKSVFNNPYRFFLSDPVPVSFYDGFFKATLEGSGYARHSIVGFVSGDDVKSEKADEPDYSWRSQALGVSISSLIDDRLFMDLLLYTNSYKAERDPKQSNVITPASSSVQEISLRAQATAYSESHSLYIFGFEIGFPEFDNTFTTSSNIARSLSTINVEAWVWLRYQQVIGRLKMDAGIHSDAFSMFDRGISPSSFQPRFSASYELMDGWQAKLSFGVFSQNVITMNNEDDIIPLFEAWVYIPDYLKPEVANHYVLGLEGNIFPRLSTSVQTYFKSYSSLVIYNRNKLYPPDPDFLNGTGEAYGLETLLRYDLPAVSAYVTYTLGWTTIDALGLSYPPRYDRRHSINVLGVYRPADNWEVTLRWEFGSGFPYSQTVGYYDRVSFSDVVRDPNFLLETGEPYSMLGPKNAARLPSYHRLDGSVAYRIHLAGIGGSVGVQVANIYNRKNILYFDRKTGQRINTLPFFPSAALNVEF